MMCGARISHHLHVMSYIHEKCKKPLSFKPHRFNSAFKHRKLQDVAGELNWAVIAMEARRSAPSSLLGYFCLNIKAHVCIMIIGGASQTPTI